MRIMFQICFLHAASTLTSFISQTGIRESKFLLHSESAYYSVQNGTCIVIALSHQRSLWMNSRSESISAQHECHFLGNILFSFFLSFFNLFFYFFIYKYPVLRQTKYSPGLIGAICIFSHFFFTFAVAILVSYYYYLH